MKKAFLFLISFLVSLSMFAQDVIVERNGYELKVNIIEVTTREVKYKMAGDTDGPTNTMLLGYIHKIIYENDSEKTFSPMYKDANRGYIKRKEPGLAALFSFLYAGAGQWYNGDKGKAAVMGGAYTVSVVSLIIFVAGNSSGTEPFGYIGVFGGGAVWIWSLIDAPVRASVINHRYKLVDGYLFENQNLGIQIKPYFAAETLTPGMHFKQAFPVYGARMSITFK